MRPITDCTWMRYIANWSVRMVVTILAAGSLLAAVASAQVRPVQGGNALDANPMAGSGGYNAVRPTTTGINGNLIMSGNVTRGFGFRGFSPIANQNTLMTNVPSAGIAPFISDSVGLPSISAGLNNYMPRPFFYPSNTTVSAGIVQNQALLPRQVSGTFSVSQYQGQMPVSPLTTTLSPNQLGPELPYAAPAWQPASTGMFRPDILAGGASPLAAYPLSSPVEVSGLKPVPAKPGTPQAEAGKAALPPEAPLTQLIRPELAEPTSAGPLTQQPSNIGGTPEANLALLPGATNAAASPGVATGAITGTAASGAQTPAGQTPAGQPAGTAAPETSSTLLTAMQRYSKAIQETVNPATPKMETPIEAAARTPGDKILLLPADLTEAQRQSARADINREQAAQMVEARLKMPIRTLAGARRTQVDRLLARAESLMQQGQYYQASHAYGTIIASTPDNPLAWLGRANALLAAGDYLSAYTALEQGIRRFPQMLQFNFDLPALVGNREVLDVRRAEIEQTLASQPNYQLRFLLGYLEYFSGLKDIGLKTMKEAMQSAPAGSIVPEAYQILASQQATSTQPTR